MTNTIAYSDTLWAYTIPAAFLYRINPNPIFIQNLLALSTYPLAAISMYFLLRYFIPKNAVANIFGAIMYAFSFPRLAQIGHLPALSNQFLPLSFLFLLRYIDTGKLLYLFALGIVTLFTISASIYYLIFFLPFLIIIGFIQMTYWVKSKSWQIVKQRIITGILGFIPLFGIGYILLQPYFLLRQQHPDFQRSLYDIHFLRASFSDYIHVSPTSLIRLIGFKPAETEHILYPTLTVFTLALLGIKKLFRDNRKLLIILLSIIIISIVLSFGDEIKIPILNRTIQLPYYYLFEYTPIFKTIRVPTRIVIFATVCLSVLAAFGIDKIKKRTGMVILFGIVFILEIWQFNIPISLITPLEKRPEIYRYFEKDNICYPKVFLPIRRFWTGNPMEKQLHITYDQITEKDNYAADIYRMYFSSNSRCPLVNGYSGFFPPIYTKIAESLEPFPLGNGVEELKNIGVKYIIGNSKMYGKTPDVLKSEWSVRNDLEYFGTFGSDIVFTIRYEKEDPRLKIIQ